MLASFNESRLDLLKGLWIIVRENFFKQTYGKLKVFKNAHKLGKFHCEWVLLRNICAALQTLFLPIMFDFDLTLPFPKQP